MDEKSVIVYFMDDTYLTLHNVEEFGWTLYDRPDQRVWVTIGGRKAFFNTYSVSFIGWAWDLFGKDFNGNMPESLEPMT